MQRKMVSNMKRSGVVLELDKKRAIVINSEGRYIIIKRNPSMFIGEEIEFESSEVINFKKRVISGALAAASVAAIIIVTVLMNVNLLNESSIYAFIDIDINPSIELSIDKSFTVIKTNYLNEDAKRLLKNIKVDGLNINEAVLEIVEISKSKGFLSSFEENVVYICASLNIDLEETDKFISSQEAILQRVLTDIEISLNTSHNNSYIIQTEKVLPETRQEAKNNKLSMGKYSLYTKTQEQGLDMTMDQIKEKPVSYVLKKINDSNEIRDIYTRDVTIDEANTEKDYNNQQNQQIQDTMMPSHSNSTNNDRNSNSVRDRRTENNNRHFSEEEENNAKDQVDHNANRKNNEANMRDGKEPQNNNRKPEHITRASNLRDEDSESPGNTIEEPGPSTEPDEENPNEGKPDEGNPDEGKPFEGNPDGGKPFEGNPDGGKPFEGNPDGGKPFEGDPDGGKPFEGNPDRGKPFEGNSFEVKPF
ncbi:UNVERIFIED_CONTAM: anti-sigma factor-like protein [Acetivibrio alkalicellulosi]